MGNYSDDLSERFLKFAVSIIKLDKELCKTYSGRHIYGQLFREGSSSGANYEEARAGESRADFIHKMQIVLKELRESGFWLKLILASNLIAPENETIHFLLKESEELSRISAKSLVTAKSKLGKLSP
jgi:four helix bundle protein